MRDFAIFQAQMNQYMNKLDELNDVFFRERPFLTEAQEKPEITELPDERREIELRIKEMREQMAKRWAGKFTFKHKFEPKQEFMEWINK